MVLFNVIFSPNAREQLREYVDYIFYTLMNDVAAESVYLDAGETLEELQHLAASIKLCENPKLRKHGYRVIHFRRHDYVMLYRVEKRNVYVDAIYH